MGSAEVLKYDVIYGDTDSMFVSTRKKDLAEARRVGAVIAAEASCFQFPQADRRSTFRCSRLYYGGDTKPGAARQNLCTLPFSKCKIAQKQDLLTAFDNRPHWSS